MNLAIIPHQDDENLFLSYTLQREKPLVLIVTDSFIQPERGDWTCTAQKRRDESIRAAELIGYPVIFGGIKDTLLNTFNTVAIAQLSELLNSFKNFESVYIPAVQGGNHQHDLIGEIAGSIFPSALRYMTYTKTELWTKGSLEIIPSQEEIDFKNKALNFYQSQINLPSTAPHFAAVRNKSEWLI